MVRAGVQRMSLPDIYKMFKTASNEDKIKLMNTYSNLGERMGEYDKDIDYRRKNGDPEALTEKMYTEGIGDVLGSAWDYTKQGAETAWDYAKKGAKKGAESLRDLVMRDVAVNDLVRGDEVIGEEQEEQQVPTNDTPLPWEVRSGEFVGSKEDVVDDWENTDLGADEQLPWEAEGNAFVGSKENADIDPLAGGMSRDPSISLFDAVNEPKGEPESEEEETLSPQEQRFLGVDSAKKEEVVESPMARRARERLEKLTAKQEYYANNPNARWSDLYKIDPERATFDYGRAKDEMAQRSQVYTPAQKSLIDAKQQNRIRMGEIQGTINTLSTETEREPWITQLNALQERDIELNNQLAELGTLGYKQMGTTTKQPDSTDTNDTGELTIISPRKNSTKYLEFAKSYDAGKYENESDVPSASTIQSEARNSKYDLSEKDAQTLHEEIIKKVKAKTTERQYAEAQAIAEKERARHRVAELRGMKVDARKEYEGSDEYKNYDMAKTAMDLYDASSKDETARRKMVYDYIKSYNSGTVLDSEIASTLGGTGEKIQAFINHVQSKAGLPPDISQEQADKIYNAISRSMNVLKEKAEAKKSSINKSYGLPSPTSTDPFPKQNEGESIRDYRKRVEAWKKRNPEGK